MSFSIGQIIYIAPNSNGQKIIPALIQEENRSKTLNGESVTYKVLIGPPNSPKSKIVSTNQISGKIFASLEELKEVVVKEVSMFIEERCVEAEELANRLYGNLDQSAPNQPVNKDGKIDPAAILDEIDNTANQQNQIPQPSQIINIHGNQAIPVNMQGPNNPPVNYQEARQRAIERMTDDPNRQLVQTENGTFKEVPTQNRNNR
jgi:multidrug efflux pump subunit AcrB